MAPRVQLQVPTALLPDATLGRPQRHSACGGEENNFVAYWQPNPGRSVPNPNMTNSMSSVGGLKKYVVPEAIRWLRKITTAYFH
jgi:hypothetical protein